VTDGVSRRGATRQRNWFRHHATSRKVAGYIPNNVIGFFSIPNISIKVIRKKPSFATTVQGVLGVVAKDGFFLITMIKHAQQDAKPQNEN
jgi:hypothetical protein